MYRTVFGLLSLLVMIAPVSAQSNSDLKPVFDQYRQEIPINHLDMPREELPETGVAMKELFDRISGYLNPPEEKKE